jgi:hypothetical protein
VAAGWADGLDAARLVQALAAAEDGGEPFQPRLRRVLDSLSRRGRAAGLFQTVNQLQFLAFVLGRRGQMERAVELLRDVAGASAGHMSSAHISAAAAYARTLLDTGRTEDARLAVAKAREALRGADASARAFPFDGLIESVAAQVDVMLGDLERVIRANIDRQVGFRRPVGKTLGNC